MTVFEELFHVEHSDEWRGNFWKFEPKKQALKWR